MKTYWVYILECSYGSYYTGSTSNLEKRLSEHKKGAIEGYTKSRRLVELVFSQYFEDVQYAISAERQIKQWTRAKKKALIDMILNCYISCLSVKTNQMLRIIVNNAFLNDGSTLLTMTTKKVKQK